MWPYDLNHRSSYLSLWGTTDNKFQQHIQLLDNSSYDYPNKSVGNVIATRSSDLNKYSLIECLHIKAGQSVSSSRVHLLFNIVCVFGANTPSSISVSSHHGMKLKFFNQVSKWWWLEMLLTRSCDWCVIYTLETDFSKK